MNDDHRKAGARERARAYRERRRAGAILVHVAIGGAERRAMERLHMIAEGERDPAALALAAQRFLASLPAVADIPAALYPDE